MAIDPLSPTGALIAALRSEVTRRVRQTPSRTANSDVRQKTAPDPAALRAQLSELVSGIDPADEQARRRLQPRLIRAVLLWEFGPTLREHPEWQGMIEAIASALEQDPDQQARLSAIVDQLRR